MTRASNYATSINKQAHAQAHKWVVRCFYTDPRANTEYVFRSEFGARKAYEYYLALLQGTARDTAPMIQVDIEKVIQSMAEPMSQRSK